MVSTGLLTAFAMLMGALAGFILGAGGFVALKAWLRSGFRRQEQRIADLEAELDALRSTIRKVAGRLGAAIQQDRQPGAPVGEAAEAQPRPPLGAVLGTVRK